MPYPYTYRSPYGNDKAEIVKTFRRNGRATER